MNACGTDCCRQDDVFVLKETLGEVAGKHAGGGGCETILDTP